MLQERIKAICENVAQSMRGHAEVEFSYGPPPVINDMEMTKKLCHAAVDILGDESVVEVPEPTMGGEDMAFFMEKVPGTFFFIPRFWRGERLPPITTRSLTVNEDVLWIGSAVMANFALTWQDN